MRLILFLKFFVVFTLLKISNLSAQDTLFIFDAIDKIPVRDVYITSTKSDGTEIGQAVFSDDKGMVILFGFNQENRLDIQHINYHKVNLSWFEIKSLKGKIGLEKRALDLIEVVVYGSLKTDENIREVPNQITIIDKKDISLLNPQTTADAISNSGDIFVQKSQMGGGSPILRGFEANRVLLVLDGIRMNNAIYRAGHLQNSISVDNSVLDRVEVFYGPGTVMYGSDGMGGVIYFSTKKPQFSDKSNNYNANAFTRFSTANFEKTAHFDLNIGSKKFASLSSITFSDFDDLRAGRVKSDSNMARYWNRYFYADRNNGMDLIRVNSNPNVQIGTAYSQLDFLQKFRYRPRKNIDLLLNFQYSTTSNVPRYDQLTEGVTEFNNGQIISQSLDYAEWNYGPQNRFLASFHSQFNPNNSILFESVKLIAAFQKIDEDRITRLFGDPLRRIQSEDVYVYTLNADFIKPLNNKINLLFGGETTYNYVRSLSKTLNIDSGELSDRGLATRYPDGGSTMSTAASYGNLRWKIKKSMTFIAGARYNFTQISANFIDTTLYDLPYENIKIPTHALTGSISLAANLGQGFQLNSVLSNAFRAPNIDDIAKLRAKGATVSMPNPDVKPERGINAEITVSKKFAQNLKLSATFYHSFLSNVLVQNFSDINDIDSIYYDGRFRKITMLMNAGKARIWGIYSAIAWELNEYAFFKGSLTYTRGRNIVKDGTEPLAHIPPLYGQVSFNYNKKFFNISILSRFNGQKLISDYSEDSSENLDKALPNGTPGWFIINVYTNLQINKIFSFNIGVENLLDWHYRPYSSGVSAGGQNIILTLRANI